MRKLFLRGIILFVSAGFLVVLGKDLPRVLKQSSVAANGNLDIRWYNEVGQEFVGNPPGPIITEDDFKPGDQVVRKIKVLNQAVDALRFIAIRGDREALPPGTPDLAKKLRVVLAGRDGDIYGGKSAGGRKSLAEFFKESRRPTGISLGYLLPGEEETYTLTILFKPGVSGKQYQGASFAFDISVGAIDLAIPAECGKIQIDEIITGTEADDDLVGTRGNDLIFGFEGDDKIRGGEGDDCLVGGPGKDKIRGKKGNDIIEGGTGDDRIKGGRGDDLIFAGSGEDKVKGNSGNDILWGGVGADELDGGHGRDFLYGGRGADKLDGGSGSDFLDGGPGKDELDGGSKIDTCVNGEKEDSCEL